MSKAILCYTTVDSSGKQTKLQQVDDDHPLPVAATVSATASTVAKATAAAPTYSEGDVAAPLSVDLAGGLRITGTINATSAATATAAAPSYVEGAASAFSQNLTGDLRTISKLAGGSAIVGKVGIDQTTPGTTNAVAGTNFPTAVDVNSGSKSNSTLRVVLATDQPALTNKLLVTPDLPSGASTAAKQPALGTAGSASADVISIQGIASMTAVKVDGSAVTQPVSGTLTSNAADVTPVLVDALSTTVKGVLASTAGKLMSYYCYNPNATVAYVQIFDIATTGGVTLGTTVPKWSIAIPATSAANLSGLNIAFAAGIQVAATTTAKGLTAPGTALDCNFGYR